MMEDMETLKDLKKVIVKELKKNVEKGTLSPPEIDSVNKAVDSLEKIVKTEKICKELEMIESNPDVYSGAIYNIRNFPPMSHGWNEWSGERGRSAATGRYVSRNYPHTTIHDGYSGHSINDRMVARLEEMMDTATSDFERQQILDKIKMIRNSPEHLG